MNFLRSGMLALALILAVPAIAQTQSTSTDMKILADEVKADKKALVAQNMQLTATEAESFWPIYDAYQQDLEKINDRMTQTILEYADASSKGTVDDATAKLRDLPYADLAYAAVDHHRALRQGVPEVVFGQGKTPEQIAGIARELARTG